MRKPMRPRQSVAKSQIKPSFRRAKPTHCCSAMSSSTTAALKRETDSLSPASPYAAAKLGGEAYCQAYAAATGPETVVLRYFNVFGPRQDPASPYAAVIPRFIAALLVRRPPIIYGDGLQTRDFTYVGN